MQKNLRPVTTRVRTLQGGVYYERISGDTPLNLVKEPKDFLKGSNFFGMPHVQQTEKWDCGLCCLGMILSSVKRENCHLEHLKTLHLGTVVWTINLAYLLKDFGIKKFTFYTIQKNISANYETDIFSLQQDAPEVNTFHKAIQIAKQRVDEAENHLVSLIESELTDREFKDHISAGNVALMLINSLLFGCLECQHDLFNEDTLCILPVSGTPYRGHYIIVCGYNPIQDTYVFKNPSANKPLCFVPASTLELSRKSFGTQQNVILIDLHLEGGTQINN